MADGKKRRRKLAGKSMKEYFPPEKFLEPGTYRPWEERQALRIKPGQANREALKNAERRFVRDLTLDRIADLEEGRIKPGIWFEGFERTMTNLLQEHKFFPSYPAEKISEEKRYLPAVEGYVKELLLAQMRKNYVDPVRPSKESLERLVKGIYSQVRRTLGEDTAQELKARLEEKLKRHSG